MKQKQAIQLFEEKRVRTVWDTEQEKWWFSIVDVTSVLIDSDYQTARKYWKVLKGLKKENLRDNMTDLEIAINMLAEATTTQISKNENPKGMAESANVAKRGGAVANDARKAVEKETSMPVVSA